MLPALLDYPAGEPDQAPPSPQDVSIAKVSSRALASMVNEHVRIEMVITRGHDQSQRVAIPEYALRPMIEVLTAISRGEPAQIFPLKAQLTTQEAADLLHVSRPHLVKLLESGAIRFTKVGTHRRIQFDELIRFKRDRDQKRAGALDELAEIAQKNDLGY